MAFGYSHRTARANPQNASPQAVSETQNQGFLSFLSEEAVQNIQYFLCMFQLKGENPTVFMELVSRFQCKQMICTNQCLLIQTPPFRTGNRSDALPINL